MSFIFFLLFNQHQANVEKGFQVWEQVCQVAEEGCGVQLPESAQDGQEEGVHHGRGGTRGKETPHWSTQTDPS